jgi:ribosomal protein S27E
MADIDIKCGKCGTVITVSEFADQSNLVCHKCGEPLKKPDVPAVKTKPSVKKLSVAEQPAATAVDATSQEPTGWQVSQEALKASRPRGKGLPTHLIWSLLLFLVLGSVMAYLRFCDGYLAKNIPLIRTYGPITIITFHILILLKAFKDSVFQGILCLLIPLYSFYYLFTVSDDFYMRSVVAGILVGIGWDSGIVFNQWTQAVIKLVNDWIASGG